MKDCTNHHTYKLIFSLHYVSPGTLIHVHTCSHHAQIEKYVSSYYPRYEDWKKRLIHAGIYYWPCPAGSRSVSLGRELPFCIAASFRRCSICVHGSDIGLNTIIVVLDKVLQPLREFLVYVTLKKHSVENTAQLSVPRLEIRNVPSLFCPYRYAKAKALLLELHLFYMLRRLTSR